MPQRNFGRHIVITLSVHLSVSLSVCHPSYIVHISYIFEVGIPSFVSGCILEWQSVANHFWVTDLVLRIIVSGAYLLYSLRWDSKYRSFVLFVPCVCHAFTSLHCCRLKGWPLGSRLCLWCLIVGLSLSLVVSWVRCGTWLYRFLNFAPFLTLKCWCIMGWRSVTYHFGVIVTMTLTSPCF